MTCTACHSTWRIRALALLVLRGLDIPLTPLRLGDQDFSRSGLGISDNVFLAAALAGRFDYVNSYLHRFPRLDISEVPPDLGGAFEFVVCSDVLEHVPPPVEPALQGLASLVRPGGFVVASVPCTRGETVEHYPDLDSYDIVGETVVWTGKDGREHCDPHPEFHGGQGRTLAFRLWNVDDFHARLDQVGLVAELQGEAVDAPEYGVPALPDAGLALLRRVPDAATTDC
jgi:hypothetical protein